MVVLQQSGTLVTSLVPRSSKQASKKESAIYSRNKITTNFFNDLLHAYRRKSLIIHIREKRSTIITRHNRVKRMMILATPRGLTACSGSYSVFSNERTRDVLSIFCKCCCCCMLHYITYNIFQ